MPSRCWISSKRRTRRNRSRTTSIVHHSPTTSRHWATEQDMSSKLLRFTSPQRSELHHEMLAGRDQVSVLGGAGGGSGADLVDHRRVGQRGGVAELPALGHVAQEAPHDL